MALVRSNGTLGEVSRPLGAAAYSTILSDEVRHTYGRIFRAQPQVRTVVSFIARNVADLGLQVFRRNGDTDRERVTDHPFADLLASPFPNVTPYRFKETMVSDLCIYDTYYAVKVKGTGGRGGLLRVSPEWVTPNPDGPWWEPDSYTIEGSRGRHVVARSDLVVIHGYNPDDPRGGLPPMESLRQLLMEDYEASRYRQAMWRSGALISGVIERPGEIEWSDTARERFRADWQSRYANAGSEVGGTPILEDGMTYKQVAFSAEQSQYIDARKLTREEVAASYHVPPPMVGILDHATFSNITEQHKNLYQDTLGPWLTLITEELQAQLLPEFTGAGDLYCEFNLQAKLRGTFEEQAAQLQTAIGGPWMTRNEGRARVNLPAIDGGDDLITPLSVSTGQGEAEPTQEPDDPPAELEAGQEEED